MNNQLLEDFVLMVSINVFDKTLIENFPLKDSLLCKLYEKYMNKSIGIKTNIFEQQDFIEINYLHDSNHFNDDITNFSIANFPRIIKIYQNPKILLTELFEAERIKLFEIIQPLVDQPYDCYHSLSFQIEIKHQNIINYFTDQYQDLFQRELEFYGLESLFVQTTHTIDYDEIKETFLRNLSEQLGEEKCANFIHCISMLGGIFSGSSLLKAITYDKNINIVNWQSNDVDIYINEGQLAYRLGLYFEDMEKITSTNTRQYFTDLRKLITKNVINFFDNQWFIANLDKPNVKLVNIADQVPFDINSSVDDLTKYSQCEGILYVIKFKYDDLNIDLIVLTKTPQYFIKNFDFAFNKIYYDGFFVNAFDWTSILSKRCKNNNLRLTHNTYLEKYAHNLARIEKYWKRGYFITI